MNVGRPSNFVDGHRPSELFRLITLRACYRSVKRHSTKVMTDREGERPERGRQA